MVYPLADHEFSAVSDESGKTICWATDLSRKSRIAAQCRWDNYVVIDLDTDKTIAEMDWRSTHTMLHERRFTNTMRTSIKLRR